MAQHHAEGAELARFKGDNFWREGFARGRTAAWLPGVDWIAMLPQPIEAVRAQLGLAPPPVYLSIPVDQRGDAVPKG